MASAQLALTIPELQLPCSDLWCAGRKVQTLVRSEKLPDLVKSLMSGAQLGEGGLGYGKAPQAG
jgi:hypothetical protein